MQCMKRDPEQRCSWYCEYSDSRQNGAGDLLLKLKVKNKGEGGKNAVKGVSL